MRTIYQIAYTNSNYKPLKHVSDETIIVSFIQNANILGKQFASNDLKCKQLTMTIKIRSEINCICSSFGFNVTTIISTMSAYNSKSLFLTQKVVN